MAKVNIGFRVEPEVKNELIDKAQSLGVTLSDYCENAILTHCNTKGVDSESREQVLTDNDLEAISSVVSQELDGFVLVLQDRMQSKNAPVNDQKKTVEDLKKESDEDVQVFVNQMQATVEQPSSVLDLIELPEFQKNNLKAFIESAQEQLELTESEVVARMLAKAYKSLDISGSGFWNERVKDIDPAAVFEIQK